MTKARWLAIDALYHGALARPPAERHLFLDEACASDGGLRADVQSLLDQPASGAGFLAMPAADVAARLIATPAGAPMTGRRLGVFEVHELLGVGGMGEVYRARDTKLARYVAIKILPRAFTADPDRLARFEREARVLASLNHPNIASIYGVEDSDDVRALVLELVEGETLAERLARSGTGVTTAGLPIAEVRHLARQIVDALDAAHGKGIVHRDLKPANVKITPDGVVKVLDFGLAKAVSGDGTGPDMSRAPALEATRDGQLMGTPAYMSPEQARGKPVDKRTDIWAFGCLLYEMITGRGAFARETVSDTIAAILHLEPDWTALPAFTPRGVRLLLRQCLDKDTTQRLRDIGDARLELGRALPADGKIFPGGLAPSRWLTTRVAAVTLVSIAVSLALLGVVTSVGPIRTWLTRAPARVGVESRVGVVSDDRILALLPFADPNPAPQSQAYSRGLAAVLTDELRLASALQHVEHPVLVIPAAEVIEADLKTAQSAQRTLGASVVLTGRLNRDGSRTVLTVDIDEVTAQTTTRGRSRTSVTLAGVPVLAGPVLSSVASLFGLTLSAQTLVALKAGGSASPAAEEAYVRGRGFLAGEADLDEAIEAFELATRLDAGYALAFAALSDACLRKYRAAFDNALLTRARASGDEAIALAPSVAYAHVVRGRVYHASGQNEQAIRELKGALEIDPGAVAARQNLAEVYEGENALQAAEDIYRQEIAAYPHYWEPHVSYGSFLFKHGRYREAETSLVNGMRYAPDNGRAIGNLAGLYIFTERLAAAEAELRRAFSLRPEVVVCNNLAWVQIYQGKFSEAIPWMEQAVRLPRADSFYWGNLARMYRWAGQSASAHTTYAKAILMAQQAVNQNPRDSRIRANFAQMLAETGRYAEALVEIAATLEFAPSDLSVLFRKALVNELSGDRSGALQALEAAARSGYSRIDIRRHPDLARLREDPRYVRMITMAPHQATQ